MSTDKSLYNKLKTAVLGKDITAVRRLLKGGVCIDNTNSGFWFEGTLLHEAVAIGNHEIVKLLLQSKPEVNARDKSGQTSLHLACRSGRALIVQLLLDHGADVDAVTMTGRSCLHVAMWQRHANIAMSLLQHGAICSINRKDEDGWTPMHWAAKGNLHSVTRAMTDKGGQVNVKDRRGQTPLHLALLYHGDVTMMKILLEAGADPNIPLQNTSCLVAFMKLKHCTPGALNVLLRSDYFVHQDTSLFNTSVLSQLQIKHKELYAIILVHKKKLPKLANFCRFRIRKHLSTVCAGHSITSCIQKLPLPELLQDFIMLKNLDAV
ncbi:hypothetical protein LSH36_932g01007 [Paralvinella palmiformis]|uniref:SOCS box domain-containing protein n=1 Tax=Paralvinella palmiformis TaxID=53620 RepID=A0AAD9MTP2_9ANNE|nr:hypothetical protein LSH36_932g01007 [Paralvinella palmiformis]